MVPQSGVNPVLSTQTQGVNCQRFRGVVPMTPMEDTVRGRLFFFLEEVDQECNKRGIWPPNFIHWDSGPFSVFPLPFEPIHKSIPFPPSR